MSNTGNPMVSSMDFTFARRCHICGDSNKKVFLRWCPVCMETYGEKRRPVSEMTELERQQETEQLMSPPHEIPPHLLYRRIMELKGEVMDLAGFCELQGRLESWQDQPMFVWPPQPTEVVVEPEEIVELTHGHRQLVATFRGMPQVELPPDASEATPQLVEEAVSSEFDLHEQTLPHGQWPRIKTPPSK